MFYYYPCGLASFSKQVLQFKCNFVRGWNHSKIHDWVPSRARSIRKKEYHVFFEYCYVYIYHKPSVIELFALFQGVKICAETCIFHLTTVKHDSISLHMVWCREFYTSLMYCANLVETIWKLFRVISSFFSLILILQGINLDSADLSKLDLRFINFKMANLRKTDLAHANLSNCCLERANLCGAHMDVSRLKSDFNLISPYDISSNIKKVWRINRCIKLLVTRI